MEQSRARNTISNSFVGMASYICISILAFINRSVFIKYLSVEYLGVYGLFSNILAVLALSDLGINTVMVYSLYKPIAEHDKKQIAVLIKYFSKLYRIIAIAIALLGAICIFLLPYIVKGSVFTNEQLIRYYLLILANTICSYLIISKSTLIRADQQVRIIQSVQFITTVLLYISQIFILVYTRNFTVYLTLPVVITLCNNLVLNWITRKKYPFIYTNYGQSHVDRKLYREIISNLKATFIYKFGATILTSTDNIIISVMLGTAMVGYYNNYYTVVVMGNAIINIGICSMIASVGNFYATHDTMEKFRLFKFLLLIFHAIAGFSAACYLAIFNGFISLWLGERFVLNDFFLFALVINTTVACICNPLWMTRESSGVFKSVRYVMLAAAVLNIIFSIVLAKIMGIAGIIIATAIARLLTLYWYEPYVLCKKVFKLTILAYWKNEMRLVFAMLPCLGFGWIMNSMNINNIFIMVAVVFLCGIVTLISFGLTFRGTEEMQKLFAIRNHFLKIVLRC